MDKHNVTYPHPHIGILLKKKKKKEKECAIDPCSNMNAFPNNYAE